MKSKLALMTASKIFSIASAILISCSLLSSLDAAPEAKEVASDASQADQKQFSTPKEAAESLIQAAESFDIPALKEILGPDSTDIISSEDPVMDKNRAIAFADKAKE